MAKNLKIPKINGKIIEDFAKNISDIITKIIKK